MKSTNSVRKLHVVNAVEFTFITKKLKSTEGHFLKRFNTMTIDFETELQKRLDILKSGGKDEQYVSSVRTSARLQSDFLPHESIIGWLDEEMVKSPKFRGRKPKSPQH